MPVFARSRQAHGPVAGLVSRAHASPNAEFQVFVHDAIEAGIGEIGIYTGNAGTAFVNSPPAFADEPDAINRIRMGMAAVRRWKTWLRRTRRDVDDQPMVVLVLASIALCAV